MLVCVWIVCAHFTYLLSKKCNGILPYALVSSHLVCSTEIGVNVHLWNKVISKCSVSNRAGERETAQRARFTITAFAHTHTNGMENTTNACRLCHVFIPALNFGINSTLRKCCAQISQPHAFNAYICGWYTQIPRPNKSAIIFLWSNDYY